MTAGTVLDLTIKTLGAGAIITVGSVIARLIWKSRGLVEKGRELAKSVVDTHQLVQTATTNHLAHIQSGIEGLNAGFENMGRVMESGFDRLEKAFERAADAQREDMRELRKIVRD